MNLNLYLMPLKKTIPIDFPNTILPFHINSGYSSHNPSMDVNIFREEEWVKVLIHECFHAFDMDFHEENRRFQAFAAVAQRHFDIYSVSFRDAS